MTTAYPATTQGGTYECGTQADYTTVSTFASGSHFRAEGPVTFPSRSQKNSNAQANIGHALDADFSDKGILTEQVSADAISFDYAMRREDTGAADPMLVTFLESAGWSCVENSHSTIAVYTSTSTWTTTADTIGADAEGQYMLVQLNSGVYYPVLLSDYTSGTKTCVAAMALPSASTAGKVTQRMYTLTPRTGAVTAAKLVSFRHRTRGQHTAAPDLAYIAKTCCLSKIGDIQIDPNGMIKLPLTFSAADIYDASSTLAAETFRDDTAQNPIQGCEVGFADAASGPTYTSTMLAIDSATISIPYTAKHQAADGDTANVLNSSQAVMATRPSGNDGRVKVTIKAVMDRTWLTAFEAQTMRYFHVVKGTTSLAVPAWAITIPRMEPIDFAVLREGADWIQMEGTFAASSANYSATHGDNSEPGDRDIFIGISGESS